MTVTTSTGIAADGSGTSGSQTSIWRSLPDANSATWIYLLIASLVAIHLSMVFGRSINGDEFWFYNQVEIVGRGEAIQTLQTIHTRFFAWWLPALPGNEIDHIIIARMFMLVCLGFAGFGIYRIAREFGDHRAALLAAAAYIGAGYVLHHGTSFRVDPIVTALLINALAVAIRSELSVRSMLLLGVLVGCAGMVTIKFVLWAPAFAGAALWRWHALGYDWKYIARWFGAGAVALAVFGVLFTLHGMSQGIGGAGDSAAGTLTNSGGRVFGLNDIIYFKILGTAASNSLPLAIMTLLAVFSLPGSSLPLARKFAVLGFAAIALTPVYYSSSSPYAYVFFLAPVAAVTALVIPKVANRYSYAGIAGAIAVCSMAVWAVERRDVLPEQHKLIDAVHTAFPEPVPYFDCCGMIGSFQKANGFRSQWGIRHYLSTGEPQFLNQMKAMAVPLAVDNNDDFSPLFTGEEADFHPEDAKALRGNFIQFWGDIYIAGTELTPGASRTWSMLVPGTYTVEGEMSVNGRAYSDGDLVELKRGDAVLQNSSESAARLVWGKNPQRPDFDPPEEIWTSF